jgi:hypothetical protein
MKRKRRTFEAIDTINLFLRSRNAPTSSVFAAFRRSRRREGVREGGTGLGLVRLFVFLALAVVPVFGEEDVGQDADPKGKIGPTVRGFGQRNLEVSQGGKDMGGRLKRKGEREQGGNT